MRHSHDTTRARARGSRVTSAKTFRLVLVASIAAVVASIVVPAFAAAESGPSGTSRPPRTIASAHADASDKDDAATRARVGAYVAAVHAAELRARIAAYVGAQQRAAVVAYVAAVQQAAASRANAHQRPRATNGSGSPTTTGAGATSPGGFLACVRRHESGGNYGAVNRGSGTAGAYQFMPSTWNNTARSAGRPDLVGVNPAAADAAAQDAMAQHLYATQGASPWTGTGC